MKYCYTILLVLLWQLSLLDAFLPFRRGSFPEKVSSPSTPLTPSLLPTTTTTTTTTISTSSSFIRPNNLALRAKLWDRLEIEEDPEPYWYLLNCVATNEMDLLRQCREVCADMPDAVKFVVPTEKKTRSHGANKMVTETKVKYPGYVFAKLRLCAEVYEAIQALDLCRSWMGTVNRKGYRKLPPAPVALNELEVEKFGLDEFEEEEEEKEEDELGGVIVDIDDKDQMKSKVDEEALKAFQGLKVDDMVKVVVPGKFYNEDGIIRRLKDGKIFVRFYTYGSMFEYWMEPSHVRKLTELEVLRGLSGPTQPITQQDFDRPQRDDRYGRPRFDESRPGDFRRNLMGGMQGAGGQRNRRQDRVANRYRSDRSGGDEAYQNDRNWNWYKDQKQTRQSSTVSDRQFNYQAGSDQGPGGDFEWAMGDVGSQWGRKPQRQNRREKRRLDNQYDNRRTQAAIEGDDDWSSFVTPAAFPSGATSDSDADEFFSSLMDDLSKDLGDGKKEMKYDPWSQGKQSASTASAGDHSASDSDESFFDAFESELAARLDKSPSSRNRRSSPKPQLDENEDFFAKLEAELGSALESDSDSSASSNGKKDVTYDPWSQGKQSASTASAGDDSASDSEESFFDALESELAARRDKGPSSPNRRSLPKPQQDENEDFFAKLEAELGSALESDSDSSASSKDASDDFFSQLEAELGPVRTEKTTRIDDILDDILEDESITKRESPSGNKPETKPKASKPAKIQAASSTASSSTRPLAPGDDASLDKCTVPVLKEMLRERGLKVSGKKSELIERLKQGK